MSSPASSERPPATWLVSFQARPGPEAEIEVPDRPPGGAYVNVYVVAASAEAAERVAREGIDEIGWWIEAFDGCEQLEPDALEGEAVDLAAQARADGAVWVFHTWPLDAPDDPGPEPS